ncbi:aminotransferase class I/II-fold pyridoxal phosphate-dependent enzyme [Cohnella ginsengisoli]|uniref:cysteine-S-conjugate beta-lyase n=1 Tax=Cohnella ginsengisoli TaxID=425004 RepID=A0A9X4KIW4_9BACL|nr:aminotransferase class I/II-fold pyridoxal phosphate-dependent enzyme [Cohnella ginsengisoli]MDG0793064.1 aminotransferase class I/II-fold pyridoxal phosphate-dependent enzyme [Cohnella ginsengisoli]
MNRFDKKVELRLPDSLKWSGVDRLFKGEDLLPLWVADMDFEAPAPVLEAIRRRVDAGLLTYTELPSSLFEAVAGWLDRRFHWKVDTSDLLFAPGVVTLLKAAVRAFTQPGDRVIVQPPVYGPFGEAVTGQGRELALNPLKVEQGKYTMDFEDLEAKLRLTGAKLLLLCSPHNPTGRVWEKAELNRLAALCSAYGVTVASDEIHSDLILTGVHTPIASLPGMAERTVTFIAPSKTFNLAGLHTSFAVATDETLRKGLDQALGHRGAEPVVDRGGGGGLPGRRRMAGGLPDVFARQCVFRGRLFGRAAAGGDRLRARSDLPAVGRPAPVRFKPNRARRPSGQGSARRRERRRRLRERGRRTRPH